MTGGRKETIEFLQGALRSLIGNSVKIGSGPAAVTGDENRKNATIPSEGWEGADRRVIRESEDLPETIENTVASVARSYRY